MKNRLIANCAGIVLEDVRTAAIAKCPQSPFPTANASTMKETRVNTLAPVSTFCRRATRCTPKMLIVVNSSTSRQAAACAQPKVNFQSPEPNNTRESSRCNAGKNRAR